MTLGEIIGILNLLVLGGPLIYVAIKMAVLLGEFPLHRHSKKGQQFADFVGQDDQISYPRGVKRERR